MLKSRITRIIAGFISCIMVFICASRAVYLVINAQNFYDRWNHEADRYTYSSNTNEVYKKLWAAGIMYLQYLDEKGEYKGSEYAEKQTVAALQEIGVMNEKGELFIEDDEDYEYRVSIGNRSFSNTEKTFDELSGEYSIYRRNDFLDWSNDGIWHYTMSDFNWYTTNYGMTYYDVNGKGYAIFDFDTTDCQSYIDNNNATIFYKLDGSTPVPYEYLPYNERVDESLYREDNVDEEELDEGYYVDENGRILPKYGNDAVPNYPIEQPTDPFEEDGLYVYRADEGGLFKVDKVKFIQTRQPEAALTIAIKPNEEIIAEMRKYSEATDKLDNDTVHGLTALIPFGVVALIMAAYVLITGGYSKKEKKFVLTSCDRVFAELPAAMIVLSIIAGIGITLYDFVREISLFSQKYYGDSAVPIFYGISAACIFGVILLMLNTLIIRLKCRSFWKTTLIYRVLRLFYRLLKKITGNVNKHLISRDMLRNDKFTRRFILRTGAVVLAEAIVLMVGIDCDLYLFVAVDSVILCGLYVYLSFGDLKAIERLNKHISAVNSGDYAKRSEKTDSPVYTQTEKLNNISAGIQTAVDKQVQSERMKIDLVTNVSHDLKTPLTSIISYIDLLSTEELPPAARDYVSIIDRKSQRLKVMVADLFDLAKATSRTDVQLEQIDAVVLTEQVLGDLADKIERSGRDVRTDIQADSAPIMADGKRMYRVFQNVIDNALKYSLEGTRIYLTLRNEGGNCIVTVKNIASYEMNFTPEEITERFTRGDESRTTEGNGLGLSIAKSFTEACGGKFSIEIDGDLFIATIKMATL
ncbi:MAG: HAMP domain-containing histidine kinase [Ruminococcus sp.]|nr:HAMP domain-containing histidine kinase [Ruminococcus sp.]